MASIDKEDASPRTAMTDMAINLADKLLDAFQKVADGSGERARGSPPSGYREEAGDQGTENDNNDGDETWHQMVEEENDNDDDDDVEEAGEEGGLGQEDIETLISPIGAHGFDAGLASQESDEGSDVVFTPTRTLQFDGSDGDDQPAVDQKFMPRGVFIESDFTHNRPQLHGSEEGDCMGPGVTVGLYQVDQSQNVRIIEGHDDVDKGAAFISQRNPFLYTQLVQLPILTADDYQCQPANLYDSLERDDHFFPEDGDCEHGSFEDGQDNNQRESVRGEGEMPGQTQHPEAADQDSDRQFTVGCAYGGHQFSSRLLQPAETDGQNKNDEGDVTVLSLTAKTISRNPGTVMMIDINQAESQHQIYDDKNVNSVRNEEPDASPFSAPFLASNFVPAMSPKALAGDKASGMGAEPTQVGGIAAPRHGTTANARNKRPRQESGATTRPRNQQVSVPSRVGTGLSMGGDNNSQQLCPRLSRMGQRVTAGGARSRVGVGTSAWQPTGGGGAQRPAVQGSASAQTISQIVSTDDAKAVSGDGDGADDGESDIPVATTQPGPILGSLSQSRMVSQGSASASNSHSRIGGVGKESNSSNNVASSSRPALARPAENSLSGNGTRQGIPSHGAQPQAQFSQLSHAGHAASARSASHSHPEHGQKSKSTGKSGAGALDDRTLLLQKQKQLQHEQQMLLLQQKQLQQQIQQKAPGQIRCIADSEQIEYHQPDAVVTQMGHVQQDQLQRQPSKGVISSVSVEVQSVEDLRSQLQSILKQQKEASSFEHQVFDYSDSATDLLLERHGNLHEADSISMAGSITRGRGYDEMSEMLDNFPSFSYKIFSDMSRGDTSSHSENAYLRDCLEKERYRRKHCEQQIQNLNAKLLELQQQLAVAVSTDKRKDIMIDQLDKQLGKVVERWKRREAEKDEYMQMVMKEKLHIEETLQKQQAMIDSFEKDLARTVEELKQEKEKSAEVVENMKEELSAAVHTRKHTEELLSAEKERVMLMEKDWEQLKESRDLAEKRAQHSQERLHEEQDAWYQREKELLSKIDQVKDANLKVMHMEREKHEQQTKKAEELEEKLHTAQTDIKTLEMEVDSATREKQSLRVEMAITEAKFENAHRTLEADLRAQMEKEISEQVNDVHEKMQAELEEVAEKHRRTVSELHQRHQRDLETQLAAFRQDATRKEEDLRQQLAEQEHQLSDYQRENTALKQAKQKLESQRMEVLAKLQFIMQSQWNEAVSLLVNTPQRKSLLNSSLVSSVGSASFSGLLPSQPGVVSNSGGPQVQSAAACLPLSSLSSPQKTSKQACIRNHDKSGSPAQISSSSSSPSCASADQIQTTSPRNRMNGSHQGSAATRVSAAHNSTAVSLEDIATLLSRGGQAPAPHTQNIHGVLHNSGLVIQSQRQARETWPHQDPQPAAASSSMARAVMIHPPQQLSHPLQHTGDDFLTSLTEDQLQEDFSFISTSDIPCRREDHSHRREQNCYAGHKSKGERSNNGGSAAKVEKLQQQLQQNYDVDRGLALSDLESTSSQSTLRDGWRSQTGIHDGNREEAAGTQARLYSKDVFPLASRDQCLSPPVKQGRDGELEAGVLQESNRLNDSYKEISRQLEEHQARQKELQHYIKMLLDKPPRTMNEQPERDNNLDPDSLENSQDTVDSEMTEATQAVQINIELQRLQQLRSRQAAEPAAQSLSPQASQRKDPRKQAGASTHATGLPEGSLQAQQLADLSYLLRHYQEGLEIRPDLPVNPEAAASSPTSIAHILNFLALLPQQAEQATRDGKQSHSARTSPKASHMQRATDRHKAKNNGDSRHHSVGPETSLSASTLLEKNDRSMTSSVKSGSSRKTEKKLGNSVSVSTPALSTKLVVRTQGKDQPVWK